MISKSCAKDLNTQGYAIFKSAFSSRELSELKRICSQLYLGQKEESLATTRSLGSLIKLSSLPCVSQIWADRSSLEILLDSLGAQDLKYSNSYFFNKAPGNPPTFWHQDWWAWTDASSYQTTPQQIGLIKVLDDISADAGAIRIIPGSHRKYLNLHKTFAESNKQVLRRAENIESLLFQPHPEQKLLELQAGDILAIDARLLHGTEPNLSKNYLGLVTSWYYPDYKTLSEPIKAAIGTTNLTAEAQVDLGVNNLSLLPTYGGTAQPIEYCENPDPKLMTRKS